MAFFIKIKHKIGRILVKSNYSLIFRKIGLRLCGFEFEKNIYIGQDIIIIGSLNKTNQKIKIGNRVSIAPRVTFILESHPNNSRLRKFIPTKMGEIVLCEDCWIGTGAIIYPGITIGKCSVVAAGSVVTKDVVDYTIVAGVPAEMMKKVKASPNFYQGGAGLG